jgi:hypothetical protein
MQKSFISIWFFIGTLLLLYGLIILTASIVEAVAPSPQHHIVLGQMHFGIYWGVLLIIIGLIYFIGFRPWKKKL